MNVRFSGLERTLSICPGHAVLLSIENRVLYSRLCQALIANEGEQGIEPYSVWEEGGELRPPKDIFVVNADPFNLPWSHRLLSAGFLEKVEGYLFENDENRVVLEALNGQMRSLLAGFGLQMHSDYAFGVEWDVRRYLKTFGYGVDLISNVSLFDNVMKFLAYVADSSFRGVLVFVNLGTFLAHSQLCDVVKRGNFLGLSVLFLENGVTAESVPERIEYTIDQDFLEN